MHDSHVKKNKQWTINKVTNASADVVSLSTPTPANKKQGKTPRDIKKDSGPALAKRVLSFPPTLPKRLGKIRKHSRDNKAINSFLKCLNSERVLVSDFYTSSGQIFCINVMTMAKATLALFHIVAVPLILPCCVLSFICVFGIYFSALYLAAG